MMRTMGFLNKLKKSVKGKSDDIAKGVDKVSEVVQDKVPDQHDDKVAKAANTVKDQVRKLDREG